MSFEIVVPNSEQLFKAIQQGAYVHAASGYSHLPYDFKKLITTLTMAISKPDVYFFRVVLNDRKDIVGVLWAIATEFYFCNHRLAKDLMLMVHPDARGTGVMRALVEAYIDWAKSIGCKEIHLGTTTELDPTGDAAKFETLGFRQIGTVHKMEL